MNRLKGELLALRKAFGNYLIFRKNPEYYAKNYLFENKGEDYINWARNERERLTQFRNIHSGEDCFIIGNGPSLNKMDLSVLNDYYTFGLNKIFLIFKRVQLDLSYLVSINPLVIEQSKEEFLKLNIPVFLSYNNTKEKISKDNFYYLNTIGGNEGFSEKITEPIYESATVTYVALQIAYYMGFKRVFLIGVDHNFSQKGNPNTVQKMEGKDVNHFDPEYFAGKNWHLADLKTSEYGYSNAKLVYEFNNRKIYDATANGKLQIFEKIDFNKAIEVAKKKK
jgi:hypothetical protein